MAARAAAIARGTRRNSSGCSNTRRSTPPAPQRGRRNCSTRAFRSLAGPRRPVHLSRPRPAGRLRDARPQAPRAGRAPLRRHHRGMADPHACRLRHRAASAGRTASGCGCAGPTRATGAEDKIAAIGIRVRQWVTLHGFCAQRRARSHAFFRHRAVRRRRTALWRDVAGRSRPAGVDAGGRHGAARRHSSRCSAPRPTLKRCAAPRTIRRRGAAPSRSAPASR